MASHIFRLRGERSHFDPFSSPLATARAWVLTSVAPINGATEVRTQARAVAKGLENGSKWDRSPLKRKIWDDIQRSLKTSRARQIGAEHSRLFAATRRLRRMLRTPCVPVSAPAVAYRADRRGPGRRAIPRTAFRNHDFSLREDHSLKGGKK